MSNIKLIATDIDGTLLTSQKILSKDTLETINILGGKGVYFIPATGRPLSSIPKEVTSLENVEYVISSNGAMIHNIKTGKLLQNLLLEEDIVDFVYKLARDKNIIIEFFSDTVAYTHENILNNLDDYGFDYLSKEYVRNTRTPFSSFEEFLKEHKHSLENINLIFTDMELRSEMISLLEEKDFATVTCSFHTNIEISNKNATKGNAVKFLCDYLGLDLSETMTFGDNNNDIDMIVAAGIGVAMGNALESVKKEADYITTTCDNDGVSNAIKKFLEI